MTLRERVAWALAKASMPDLLHFPTDWGVLARLSPSGAAKFLRMADEALREVGMLHMRNDLGTYTTPGPDAG